jgi:DNA polymerase sigma
LINFLLAAIIEARPQDNKDKELFKFIHKFRHAFVSYNLRIADFDDQQDFLNFWYYNTNYDLIKFSSRSISKILNKIKEIKNNLPSQMPFEPGLFLDKARFQNRSLFCEFTLV